MVQIPAIPGLMVIVLSLTTGVVALGQSTSQETDSVRMLHEITVKAYATGRPLSDVPASIGFIGQEDLNRFSNASVLAAVNTVPGVRMEERSPGSYRFSIRGSLLRSPFGVRNVKMYYNGLPLTDGGGNTYLNLLDFNMIGNMEIIKGPGASLYGAGTGGVVLTNSGTIKKTSLQVSALGGSYGLKRSGIFASTHSSHVNSSIQLSHQEAEGYREQAAMRRDAANVDLQFSVGKKGTLSAFVFYSDLFYETPGGLTKAQFDSNPKHARPGTPVAPGAVQQKAAVHNKTFYAGLYSEYQWSDQWTGEGGIFFSNTDFRNPSIRNYEVRHENNAGARMSMHYRFNAGSWTGKLSLGGEAQLFVSPIDVYGNNSGFRDTLQTADDITSAQFLPFAQLELELPKKFYITVGASSNFLKYRYEPRYATFIDQERNFDPVFSPRVAVLKKFSILSVFGSISRGFSPPSIAEVRPSTNSFNSNLNPEHGMSYEIGAKSNHKNLSWDLALYDFRLRETIVIQRTDDGAEYFINAGKTTQQGAEVMLSWSQQNPKRFMHTFRMWCSYSLNYYRFREYIQDGADYSDNKLTGISPNVLAAGLDLSLHKRIYANITVSYTDKIPLDDANSAFADSFTLLSGRIGYKTGYTNKFPVDIFGGVDNALNERYSLGNDLNAFGGRFYNAAAPVNFYVGINAGWNLKPAR